MADITLDVDTTQVSRFLRDVFEDQMPFATAKAINGVALNAQKVQRRHQRDIFEVRNTRFMDRAVRIRRGEFATKRNPRAIIRIDPPGDRDDILTKFETERRKTPFSGSRLAVPVNAKRTKTGRISKRTRFNPDEFTLHGEGPRAKVLRNAKRRQFAVLYPGGAGFVFQRKGRRGATTLELLHVFRPEVPITPNLNFVRNVEVTVSGTWADEFGAAFDLAVSTARSPSTGIGRAATRLGGLLVR